MGRFTTFVTGWVAVVSLVSVASGSTAGSVQRCLETPDHPACSKSGIARLELAKGFPPMIDYDMKELEKAWDRIIKPTKPKDSHKASVHGIRGTAMLGDLQYQPNFKHAGGEPIRRHGPGGICSACAPCSGDDFHLKEYCAMCSAVNCRTP